MNAPHLSTWLAPKLGNTAQLVHLVKLAQLMGLTEKKFGEVIAEIESHHLFRRYLNASAESDRIFGYRQPPRTSTPAGFSELKDTIMGSGSDRPVEGFLADHKDLVALCRKIGMTHFERYFLYNDGSLSTPDIARVCGISEEEAERAMELVNHIAIQEEFDPKPSDEAMHQRYSRIADIEQDADGQFRIRYRSLKYARGRYNINYERLQQLKKRNALSARENNEIKGLVQRMEMINARKSTVHQILEKLLDRQNTFLSSRDRGHLKPLPQQELARELDVHGSTISRAVAGKSIGTPWNEEMPIKMLLVKGPIFSVKAAIHRLVSTEKEKIKKGDLKLPYRDEEIKNLLKVDCGMNVATRTVAKYRADLGFENIYARAKEYQNGF